MRRGCQSRRSLGVSSDLRPPSSHDANRGPSAALPRRLSPAAAQRQKPQFTEPSLRARSRGRAMTAPPFTVTFFDHRSARFKREVQVTLPELREMIEAETAERKDLLPWVKFALFGNLISDKGSLRHDANVLWVTGCEADYDGEFISFDEGKDK